MLSVVLFADDAGRVVLSRDFRGEVGRLRVADFCASQLRAGSGALARGDAPPVTLFDNSSFVVRRVRDAPGPLWLVSATSSNANVACVVELLAAFERLLRDYFAGETLSASAIRGKAALVFALLDEARRCTMHPRSRSLTAVAQILDHGLPQVLEPAALRHLVPFAPGGGGGKQKRQKPSDAAATSLAVTGAVSWRPAGVRYARNAVFLDVLEAVDATLSASGALLFGSVSGCVRVRSELSGTPHCVMALNDSLRGAPQPGAPPADEDLTPGAPERYSQATRRAALASSFTFHRCVRLRSGDGDDERREVAFVPPDGEFELLRYRAPLDAATPPPLKLISSVLQHGRTRLEIVCLVRTQLPAGATATAVRVRLPLPRAAAAVTLRCGGAARAKAKWLRAEDTVLWKLPELASGQEGTINVAVELLPSVIAAASRWVAPSAQLAFTVVGQTATGLRVRQLRVTEKANYEVTKCARSRRKRSTALRLLTPALPALQVGSLRALLRSLRGAPANLNAWMAQ